MQVTNQMILACKSYITNSGRDTVWTQPATSVLEKLNSCLRLYDMYGDELSRRQAAT
jgi:dynein heavy chain